MATKIRSWGGEAKCFCPRRRGGTGLPGGASMKLRGEAGPLRIDHTRSNEIRSEDRSPVSWRHSTPSGGDGQQGIATKSHKKPQKRAAPKPTPLRGLCALCVKSSHAKLAKNAKELEWPGRRRRVGVATNKGKRQNGFSCTLCFSWQ